jgi:hypothetical protein
VGQKVRGLQVCQGRAVLGEDDVGRRPAPLGHDLVGQDRLVVGVHPDVDPGLGLERLDEGVGGLDVLAVVEGDRVRSAATGSPAGGQPGRHCDQRDRRGHLCPDVGRSRNSPEVSSGGHVLNIRKP